MILLSKPWLWIALTVLLSVCGLLLLMLTGFVSYLAYDLQELGRGLIVIFSFGFALAEPDFYSWQPQPYWRIAISFWWAWGTSVLLLIGAYFANRRHTYLKRKMYSI